MNVKIFLIFSLEFLVFLIQVNCEDYENHIVFTVYKSDNSTYIWKNGTNLTAEVCDANGKFAFVVHGWEGSNGTWIPQLVDKLLQYRGGCVIEMNWGYYSDNIDYEEVVLVYYEEVTNVLTGRLFDLYKNNVSPKNMFMYGHSLGGRMVIASGKDFRNATSEKVFQIDACDSAGPGFELYDIDHNSTDAAENVQCVHTSVPLGTSVYKCHQDWLMGKCGISQPAAEPVDWFLCQLGLCPNKTDIPELSHSLCNDFYISAFENLFLYNNCKDCSGVMDPNKLPPNFKMGYMEMRRNSSIVGKIPSPTSKNYPYNDLTCE